MKNITQKIFFSTLLAIILLPSFAFAQTSPVPQPVPVQKEVLTKANFTAAQESLQKCREYSGKVLSVTGGEFKAIWNERIETTNLGDTSSVTPEDINNCHIAPAWWTMSKVDGVVSDIVANPSNIPSGSIEIQSAIQHGDGIDSQTISKASLKDLNDQQQAALPSKVIGGILNAVLSAINFFILWVAAVVGSIFTIAVNWILQNQTPAIITVGWTIVRDICNMFFILVMIAISLGTILRLKDYSEYGHLLGELVLMAILVNFSKVIAVTLINFVNLISYMFVSHDWKEIWLVLYRYVNFGDLGSLPNGWMTGLIQGLSKLLFSFVGLATFIALTGLLVVRIVAMYILIILSPLAYTLDILPATKHYAHEWWEYFIKNLIWVPVSLFLVKLSLLLAPQMTASDSAFNVIILMAFLWGAVIVAEHMGAAGGKMVVNFAEKAGHTIGESMLRGQPWAAAGEFAASRGWIKHGGAVEKTFTSWQRGAQNVEGAYQGVKSTLKRGEHHYEEGVEDRSTRIQERLGLLGDFDKNTISGITPKFIHELARDGKLNANRIRNIYEHGTRKQKDSLRLALRDGHFNANTPENQVMRDMITEEDQKMNGVNPQNRLGWQAYRNVLDVRQTGSLRPGETWAQVQNDERRYDNRQAHVRQGTYGNPQQQGQQQQSQQQPPAGNPSGGNPRSNPPGNPDGDPAGNQGNPSGNPPPGNPGGNPRSNPPPLRPNNPRGPVINYTPPPRNNRVVYAPPPPPPPPGGTVVVDGGGYYTDSDYNNLNISINHNHYDVLGVSKNATIDEIRSAFRERSRQTHPDVNNGNDDEFKKVTAAYNVLKEQDKRLRYDQIFP